MKDTLLFDGMIPASIDLVQENQYAYWLIDPMLNKADIEIATKRGWKKTPLPLQHDDIPTDDLPYLLEADGNEMLRYTNEFFLAAKTEVQAIYDTGVASPHSLCAFITSNSNARALSKALAKQAIIKDHTGKKRILRFWDPRVQQHVAHNAEAPIMLPNTMPMLWSFLDSSFQVCQLATAEPNRPKLSQPLNLADTAWLNHITKLNQLFTKIAPDLNGKENEIWAQLAAHLKAVSTLKLTDENDEISAAAMRFKHAVALENAPHFMDLVQQSKAIGIALTALLIEWDEEDWAIVKKECTTANNTKDAL